MTAPSIKEALDYLEAAANWMQRYLDTYGELGDDATQANIDDWHDAVKQGRTTLSPPAGERRDGIARIIYDAFPFNEAREGFTKPGWIEGGNSVRQDDARRAADKILASGPVQDEAAIRADEREKCAKIAESCHGVDEGDLPSDVRAGERIAAAIRSARNGNGS